jgi:hypothetical protein
MENSDIEAVYVVSYDLRQLDQKLVDRLWEIFAHICRKWRYPGDLTNLKSRFSIFVSNRIVSNYNYLAEYINAVAVVDQIAMQASVTTETAIERILTAPDANLYPPYSPTARARQFVTNEFIKLFISLGGFKAFNTAEVELNYPGYIAGINDLSNPAYKTYQEEADNGI